VIYQGQHIPFVVTFKRAEKTRDFTIQVGPVLLSDTFTYFFQMKLTGRIGQFFCHPARKAVGPPHFFPGVYRVENRIFRPRLSTSF
jgi:hypothetical protein